MAHEKDMYIGTRTRMDWVPAPTVNGYDNSPVGWVTKQDFLNGGTRIRRSVSTHREFSFSWNLISRENSRKIMDLWNGLMGVGPIYFLDPFAMNQNLAPAQWAAPMIAGYDGPLLIKGAKPVLSDTAANTLGYPVQTATYAGDGDKRKLYIPIPSGYTLWAGVHGPSTGGSIVASPAITPTNVSTGVVLPALSVSSNVRVGTSFAGTAYVGVEFTLQAGASYTGFMVQVLPDGAVPATGGFISGQGHSGSEFRSTPSQEPYSAVKDMVGVHVELAEVNDWL